MGHRERQRGIKGSGNVVIGHQERGIEGHSAGGL